MVSMHQPRTCRVQCRVLLQACACIFLWEVASSPTMAQWPGDESQVCDSNKQSGAECSGHLIVPPPSCICSDVPVQGTTPHTCAEEYNDGNCGQGFVTSPILAIPEGYCQLTCGRCNCAESVSQVLQKLQANTFLQAATMTGMKAQFDLPGFTATVLAPSDAAFATFLHGAPLSSMTNDALLALLELHVLPPVAGLLTPWTTPFLATSPTLPTWLGGANSLTTGKAANGPANFTVSSGTGSAANIVVADMEAARSYVDILDAVLSVPVNTAPVPLPTGGSGPNGAVGIATFNMTASSSMAPAATAVQTAG